MAKRTIAIGDIHGCDLALESLLNAIGPTADDTIVPLGDYVDRGPNSRRVLDLLTSLVNHCRVVPLLGNHELMMLDSLDSEGAFRFWMDCGGRATLDSYGGALDAVPDIHWAFLRGLARFYETDSHFFVHASYEPGLGLEDQPDMALLWEHVVGAVPRPHYSGKTAVVGHTPQASGEVLDHGHLICIDTYCVGGGWLTALDVESRTIWQADVEGTLREAVL